MVVTITPYNAIFAQGYNNYYYYGTIRNIYTTSLNAFINFVNIYINSPAVWCFSHSLDYQMIQLTEIQLIPF